MCYAWLLGYPPVFVATVLIAARYGGLSILPLLLTPVGPMVAGAVMLLAVTALRPLLHGGAMPDLLVLVLAGAVTYGAVVLVAFRPLIWELVGIVHRRQPVTGV